MRVRLTSDSSPTHRRGVSRSEALITAAVLAALAASVPAQRQFDELRRRGLPFDEDDTQAVALGAEVTAIDRSGRRLELLQSNLDRLRMQARVERADLRQFSHEGGFDAVLLDAPCSATGTIRRHPEIAWTRTEADIQGIAEQQRLMLGKAVALLRPGGRLVYCTCSLEPEEGEAQARWLLEAHPELSRVAIDPAALGLGPEALTADGDLRTHAGLMADTGGMDGFFATVMQRAA